MANNYMTPLKESIVNMSTQMTFQEALKKLNVTDRVLEGWEKKFGCKFIRRRYSQEKVSLNELKAACENSPSMAQAAKKMNMSFGTFKRYAQNAGLYSPNQAGKGISKKVEYGTRKIKTEDILNGKYPHYNTNNLRLRLLREGLKEHKCENCGLSEWVGCKIPLELDHKDGIKQNHTWGNLRLLCPNCHALTPTYAGKNMGIKARLKGTIYDIKKKKVRRERKKNKIIKKVRKPKTVHFCKCGNPISDKKYLSCRACLRIKSRKVTNRPPYNILLKLVSEKGYLATGREYGVSDNAIRKWISDYGKIDVPQNISPFKTQGNKKKRETNKPTYAILNKKVNEDGYAKTGREYGVSGSTIKKWILDYRKINKNGDVA